MPIDDEQLGDSTTRWADETLAALKTLGDILLRAHLALIEKGYTIVDDEYVKPNEREANIQNNRQRKISR